jgi:hypothetical protein
MPTNKKPKIKTKTKTKTKKPKCRYFCISFKRERIYRVIVAAPSKLAAARWAADAPDSDNFREFVEEEDHERDYNNEDLEVRVTKVEDLSIPKGTPVYPTFFAGQDGEDISEDE